MNRKGSLLRKSGKNNDDDANSRRVSPSTSFTSSGIPTPQSTERASTLPSIRSLRNRFFHPGSSSNQSKASAGPKVTHGSGDLTSLFSASPTRSNLSQPTSSIPTSASFSSYEANGRPSTGGSIKSSASYNSLLPRPYATRSPPVRRHSATLIWPSEALENGSSMHSGSSSINEEPELIIEGTSVEATAGFDAIPHPDGSGSDRASLDAVGGASPTGHPRHISVPHSDFSPSILPSPILVRPLESPITNEPDPEMEEDDEENVTARTTAPNGVHPESRASSSLAMLFSEHDGVTVKRGPTPLSPTLSQQLNGGDTLVPPDRHSSPSGGARSPLDALVFGLGGRPMSRASSVASGGRASSTETGPSSQSHIMSRPPLPLMDGETKRDSIAGQTDTTSVREMEMEIRRIESESEMRGRTVEERTEQEPKSKWSRTTTGGGSGKSAVPAVVGGGEEAKETLVNELPPKGEEITPRTAKRWSIVEMEESFRRMQSMLQSSRGSAFSTLAMTDDGRATPNTNSFILDQAMASLDGMSDITASPLRQSSQSSEATLSSPRLNGDEVPQVRVQAASRPSTGHNREEDTKRRSRSPDTGSDEATVLPGHFPLSPLRQRRPPSAVPEEAEAEDELGLGPPQRRPSPSHSRRHTLDDVPSHEAPRDAYKAEEIDRASTAMPNRGCSLSPGKTSPALFMRRSRSQLQPVGRNGAPRLVRSKTEESIATSAHDDGWATPRTSVSPAPLHARSASSDAPSSGDSAAYRSSTPVLKSQVGRGWTRDRERTSTPTSTSGESRTTGGGGANSPTKMSGRQYGSARFAGEVNYFDPEKRRSSAGGGGRRSNQVSSSDEPHDTWFNDTPGRARFRPRPSLPSRFMQEQHDCDTASIAGGNQDVEELTVSTLRRADKVELFLRYSAVKTELDAVKRQSALEREALLDMLTESRDVVHDLRNERNRLEERLQKETASLRSLSAALGGEEISLDAVDRLADMARQKALWQQRATSAAGELERCREDIARLEAGAEVARERDDEATKEIEHLEDRVGQLTRLLRDAQAALREARSPTVSPTVNRSPAESPRAATFAAESPTTAKRVTPPKAIPRPNGHAKAASHDSGASPIPSSRSRIIHQRSPSGTAVPPISRLPSTVTPRNRTVSTTSSTASLERAAETGTPLQRTRLSFPPRTPGSQASPLGNKGKAPVAATTSKIPSSGLPMPKARTSPIATRSGIPSPIVTPPSKVPVSGTAASSPASTDVGFIGVDDHRFPRRTGGPMSDGWPTPNLRGSNGSLGMREDDEMFLADIESSRESEKVEEDL